MEPISPKCHHSGPAGPTDWASRHFLTQQMDRLGAEIVNPAKPRRSGHALAAMALEWLDRRSRRSLSRISGSTRQDDAPSPELRSAQAHIFTREGRVAEVLKRSIKPLARNSHASACRRWWGIRMLKLGEQSVDRHFWQKPGVLL